MSGPRDFEDDELEPAKPPWWRQRRALTLGGASLIVIALFAVSQTQRAPAPPAAKNGPDFIGVVVPYTPAKAAPVPPPALSRPLPQVMPAMATPAAPVTRPAMLSYKVDIKDPPASKAADPPDQTGLQIGTAKIPGVKASPALDETYLLMPGLLPCVLDTAILSDLPGPLMCHLPGPVYSSKGVLLMEAGTQVIGQYQSLKNNGVGRLMAVSTYAHTPEGIWVPLTGNPLADDLGRSGLDGAVDNHYLQRFGGAVLLDLTQSGLQIVQADVSKGGNTYISTSGTDNLAEQILQATINIPPTFSKNQGETIAIWLANPIDFSDSYRIRPRVEQ